MDWIRNEITNIPIVVAETSAYLRSVETFWDKGTQDQFKFYIARYYEKGDIIPGLNGIRKIRWKGSGHGKRGGVRVIYYFYNKSHPLYLLFAYAKNVQEDLTPAEIKLLSDYVEKIKTSFREGA